MSDEQLIQRYQQLLGLQGASFSLFEHEDAMVTPVYKIVPLVGEPLVLKICLRFEDYLREIYFLKYFANTLPVPHIIDLIAPEKDFPGAILMKYLPGKLLKVAEMNQEIAFAMGSLLAQIHQNSVEGYGDLTQKEDLTHDPSIHFKAKFEEGLEECEHHLPNTLIEKCQNYFDTHLSLLSLADGPCIIHRDFRPGNLIVHQGKIRGIIDWSSGRGGFAQQDFCFLEHVQYPLSSSIKTPFIAGYASVRPVPNYMDLMPLLRLNKAIATIGFTVKRDTWNHIHAKLYQFNRQILETLFHL